EGVRSRQAGGDPGVRRRGRTDLPGQDRQVPLPDDPAAPGCSAAVGSLGRLHEPFRRQADFFAGALRDREPPFEAAFPSLEPSAERRVCAAAAPWRRASIRPITRPAPLGPGPTISPPPGVAPPLRAPAPRGRVAHTPRLP